MDAKLPWHRRLAIRVHLLYCVWCRRYASQLWFLRRAAGAPAPEQPEALDQRLSMQAKEQMCARLQEALKRPPASPQ